MERSHASTRLTPAVAGSADASAYTASNMSSEAFDDARVIKPRRSDVRDAQVRSGPVWSARWDGPGLVH